MALLSPNHPGPNVSILARETYAETANDDLDRRYLQAERVRETLRVFGKDLLSIRAIEAAALIPVADQVQSSDDPEVRLACAQAISKCLDGDGSQLSQEDGQYMMSIWGDLPYINEAAKNYRSRLNSTEAGQDVLEMLDGADNLPLPEDIWLNVRMGINIPLLVTLSETVNVESIVANAAYRLDELVHAEPKSREELELILEIETFYAPLLDALGMSAFEMMLRSEVSKIRLTNAGRTDLLGAAAREIEKVQNDDVGLDPVLQKIFTNAPQEKNFEINDQTPYDEKISFSEANLLDMTGGKFEGRLIARVKSLGSLAQKMLDPRYKGEMPQDIVGITAVVSDESELARYFEDMLEAIEKAGCELKPAKSKDKALYIQGTRAFIDFFKETLQDKTLLNTEINEEFADNPLKSTFQVVKMTFMVEVNGRDILVEFQFMTSDDRSRARLGGVSHLLMKKNAKGVNGLPGTAFGDETALERINERRKSLQEGDRNNIVSINNHGDEYGYALADALQTAA